VSPDEECPYKGLASFSETDSEYFFGRERLVGELAARTVGVGLLGVVGASGSGKSSVVAAGLLPSLRVGLLPGSERWQHVIMRPGERPLAELQRTIDSLSDQGIHSLEQVLEEHSPETRLVLVVDQFEETFTACSDEEERAAFIAQLTGAASQVPDHLVVVLTLRDDCYGACAPHVDLAGLLGANHVLVPPMSRDELARAIELPARRAGLRVELALTDRLVEEVADEPGGLPLLSTTLVELWQERSEGWIRLETYERTGGVRGAVARMAEESFAHLDGPEREAARAVLLRLTGIGEGDVVTRRRVPISEFDLERDPVIASVLTRLTQDRLLTMSETTVEVAHEALLREWPRLRGWLEEDLQSRQLRLHLTQMAKQWDASGREPGELYRGARLSATLDWTTLHGRELNELEQAFLGASREATEQEAVRQRRTNRRLRGLLVGVAIFLVVALVAGLVALAQSSRARNAAAAAEHSATVALAQSLGSKGVAEPRLDTGLLLATEGVKLNDSVQTRNTLLTTLLRQPSVIGVFQVGQKGTEATNIAIRPDGRTLAVTTTEDELRFYDTSTWQPIGRPIPKIAGYAGAGMAFTRDGSKLLVQAGNGAQLFDIRTHEVFRSLAAHPERSIQSLALSPNGGMAYAQAFDFIERWDTGTERRLSSVQVSGLPGEIFGVADSTGEVVTATTDGTNGAIQVRDGTTLAARRSFPVPNLGFSFFYVDVTPDGRTAALTAQESMDQSVVPIRFIDLRTGKIAIGIGGSGGNFLTFSPDGRSLASVDGTEVLLWDVPARTVVQTLSGHAGGINGLTFDASGRTLYASSVDGTVFAYDVTGAGGLGRRFSVGSGDHLNAPAYATFSATADGARIAVTESDGKVNVVDVPTGRIVTSFRAIPSGPADYAGLSPDGREIVVAGEPGIIAHWRLGSGEPTLIRTFSGLLGGKTQELFDAQGNVAGTFFATPWATFSPDGRWIAGIDTMAIPKEPGESPLVKVRLMEWNASTGAERTAHLDLTATSATGNLAYSPDGSLIAMPFDNDIVVLDAGTLKVVRKLAADPSGVTWIAFSPSGRILASAGNGGVVRIWNVPTWKQIGSSVQVIAAQAHSIAFDPSGQVLLVTGTSGRTSLWSVPGLHQIGKEMSANLTGFGGWSTSGFAGSSIVLMFNDGEAFEWPGSVGEWQRHACVVAGRNLTRAEWKLHVPDRPYQKTCPQEP
jgi:WD40 repeat protein